MAQQDAQHPPLSELMAPDWAQALEDVASTIHTIGDQLVGTNFLPAGPDVLRALHTPMERARVLIVGQDPYPTPGHPIGLSFAVEQHVRPLPRSLVNIYTELHSDLGIEACEHGDLTRWSEQGVLLLNRTLTVLPGTPGSHSHLGWQRVTDAAIASLAQAHRRRSQPLVAILWGSKARELSPVLQEAGVPIITSPHPSPLSAHRGFFGSRPFSRANELLIQQGAQPIDWRVC